MECIAEGCYPKKDTPLENETTSIAHIASCLAIWLIVQMLNPEPKS